MYKITVKFIDKLRKEEIYTENEYDNACKLADDLWEYGVTKSIQLRIIK